MPHERSKTPNWASLAATDSFATLLRRKRRFIVPATVFFIVYYFALPVLVGYFPEFMSRKVLGPVNLAYLFALSQFVMAWVLAWLYVRAAERFDILASELRRAGEHTAASSSTEPLGETPGAAPGGAR
jgi:uncharacterized membrane protein (DUF485 family)